MSHLTIVPKWNDNINQVETTEPIMGGAQGNANLATRQLAENLFWLKNKVEGIPISTATDGFEQNLSQNGYCKLPNGLILQWGYYHLDANPSDTEHRVSFPTPFDRACFSLIGTRVATAGNTHEGDGGVLVIAFNQNEFRVALQNFNVTSNAVRGFYWLAVGH